jgi:uncharacterized membrane protein
LSRIAATVALCAAAAGCGLLHRHHKPAPPYWVTDLGPLPGGKTTQVMDLNDAGVAVGRSDFANSHGHQHAVIWEKGKPPRDLGTLDGGGSEADRISPASRIVGWSSFRSVEIHACDFSVGKPVDLGTGHGTLSLTYGVADDGRIGVSMNVASGAIHSFLLNGAKSVDIGALPAYRDTSGSSLAPNGTVAGTSDDGHGGKRAFIWSNGSLQALPPPPGDTNSYANAVNQRGDVAGSCSQGAAHFQAVEWTGGRPTALLTPAGKESEAVGIGANGEVVGECNNHACLWRAGRLIDLNSMIGKHSTVVLNTAVAMNASGQIACNGTVNKQAHAFLLTPSRSDRR